MPRTGGIYSAPAGTKGIPNTTVASTPYNSFIDDLVQDANAARPITAGGTGANNATDARVALGALASTDILSAPTKAVPVDGDGVVITDSEDSGKLKRTLWSVIKAKLKDYFDPIYQPILTKVAILELNGAQTVDAFAIIDFHSSVGSDFNARILRNVGINSSFDIVQTGTGPIRLHTGGGVIDTNTAIDMISTLTVKGAAGSNSHVWFRNLAGVSRGVVYAGDDNIVHVQTGVGNDFRFGTDGNFYSPGQLKAGTATFQSNGDVNGSLWNQFGGGGSMYNDQNARVESRAAAFADDRMNRCVTSSRMAGYVEAQLTSSPPVIFTNNGYVLTMGKNIGGGAFVFGARQPQLFIPNLGWFAAFQF